MSSLRGRVLGLIFVTLAALALSACGGLAPRDSSFRSQQPLASTIVSKLNSMGSSPGAGMLIRVFKESNELEVWRETKAGPYKLFKTYNLCAWSGVIGPKLKEGDRQAPEGFYTVTPGLMNPNSIAYLSLNTGYPNKYDKALGRTGADLMIHGDCSSRGCYALTNEDIAEIYAMARESFAGGNTQIQLQLLPFRMTPKNLAAVADNPNMSFWNTIKEGYDRFEISKRPPVWDVCDNHYVFDLPNPAGGWLDAAAACPARGSDPLLASLTTKQVADNAAYDAEVAAIAKKRADEQAAEQKRIAEETAAKARGEAIGGLFSGIFGGSQPATETGSIDPTKVAPIPAPLPSFRQSHATA